jgi:enoyl-CoA hydratase/carnithine racemase
MAGEVRCELAEGVARVSLHHPGKFNAMSRAMWRALRQTFEGLNQTTGLRCIVLQGEGGNFCAGGDITEYPSFRFDLRELEHFHEVEVWGALQSILDCDLPVLAQIEGNCMGAGVEIASCCDMRLAASDARFGAPIARLGFPMAPRELDLVEQATGETTARAMLLAAEVFDAQHMYSHGFLTRVLEPQALAPAVQALAERVAVLAPAAARMNKQYLRSGPQAVAAPYAYAQSEEHREGIQAFLEKRSPRF